MKKVLVSYRVLQSWRVPVFERLANTDGIDLTVLYSADFAGSKVKSYSGPTYFKSHSLFSINFKIPTSNGKAFVPFCPFLFFHLSNIRPDLIIAEGPSNFINNIICFIYAKIFRCKVVQWGLGEITGRRLSVHRRLLNLVFNFIERHSDAAIAYSSIGVEYYLKVGLPRHLIFKAVNVVDTSRRFYDIEDYSHQNMLQFPSPVPKEFNILFVGAITHGKNVDLLLYAYRQFVNTNPLCDHRLTIVGDGDELDNVKKLAGVLDLSERVKFTGHLSTGLSEYFYHAAVFVLPGLGGLAVSDSLTHGVPVICTVGDGCERDLVQQGVNGFFIELLTADVLAAKLAELYCDRNLLASLRSGAQKFIKGPYTIESYVNNIKEVIDVLSS